MAGALILKQFGKLTFGAILAAFLSNQPDAIAPTYLNLDVLARPPIEGGQAILVLPEKSGELLGGFDGLEELTFWRCCV